MVRQSNSQPANSVVSLEPAVDRVNRTQRPWGVRLDFQGEFRKQARRLGPVREFKCLLFRVHLHRNALLHYDGLNGLAR
jgi:hypothetical protein